MDWQPIETAPKNETRILGWDGDRIAVTKWNGIFRDWRDESTVTDDGYGWYGHDNWHPTHWMSLPDEPRS